LQFVTHGHNFPAHTRSRMAFLRRPFLCPELLVKDPVAAKRMLFMTGDVIKANFQEFLKQHNRTCLPKPFALREFHAALAGIVNAR
jgi:hypothetical protein